MRITVDTDRMAAFGGAVRSVTDTLKNNMDAMEILADGLNGAWQGEAGRAFAGRLLCVRREFREIENFFGEYASALEGFAREYGDWEDELAARIANV
ncbi:MAG: WXG100 family type VII secretion target [Lachnospiraceae bacterium]|jgi:uncharacterized protein YukE|nr:WXG100 family type VII secretion target [Lachnospiraceae bacterium]